MKKIKLGVVGLGHRGRWMFQLACRSFDFVEPTAACDILPRNFYEKQWLSDMALAVEFPDCKFYESYDEMLENAGLDAVIVETGADIHAQFCVKALKKNINVLCDIPVVANLKEAEELWKAAKESTAIISVGANPNEQKFTVLLRENYENGLLGKPYYAEAEYIHWSFANSEESKGLNENGNWRKLLCPIRYCTHSLGPLLTVMKSPLRTVSCFGTGPQTNEVSKDEMSCAQFQAEDGAVIRLLQIGRAHV